MTPTELQKKLEQAGFPPWTCKLDGWPPQGPSGPWEGCYVLSQRGTHWVTEYLERFSLYPLGEYLSEEEACDALFELIIKKTSKDGFRYRFTMQQPDQVHYSNWKENSEGARYSERSVTVRFEVGFQKQLLLWGLVSHWDPPHADEPLDDISRRSIPSAIAFYLLNVKGYQNVQIV